MTNRSIPPYPPAPPAPPGAGPAPAPRKAAFNVQMDEADYARLDALAGVLSRSRGACLREALKVMHQMVVQGIPTCASGAFCVVPNVHANRGPIGAPGAPEVTR